MDGAKMGHTVKFQGLKGAAHLNGTEGTLVKYMKKEGRWSVRCEDDGALVCAKPENLIRKYMKQAKEEPVLRVIPDEELFKVPSTNEEDDDCPICCIPLDLDESSLVYKECCGKTICIGCAFEMDTNDRSREQDAPCPFCRTPYHKNDQEYQRRMDKLIDENNSNIDSKKKALFHMGYCYFEGKQGLPQSYSKSIEYMIRSAQLGYSTANYNLGCVYRKGDGVKEDTRIAVYYWSLASIQGSSKARHSLAAYALNTDNDIRRAMKHYRIAAEQGNPNSMAIITASVLRGHVTKAEYDEILAIHNQALDSRQSERRDRARQILGIKTHDKDHDHTKLARIVAQMNEDDDITSLLSRLGIGVKMRDGIFTISSVGVD
eukprot:scaffold4911_cov47-Cyclotella_meneghiniana.AAC.4